MQTIIVEDRDAEHAQVYETALRHVQNIHDRSFAARMASRPPRMAVALNRDGQIACAAAIRCSHEGFFSQHYLDEPVSAVLSRRTGLEVSARDLLEVGGLACTSPFSAYPTLQAIFEWGRQRGIGWGLFTATAEIRRLIQRARITPLLLAQAQPSRVPDSGQWGSYYDHDPWLCAFRDPTQIPQAALQEIA